MPNDGPRKLYWVAGGTFAVALVIALVLFGVSRLRFHPESHQVIQPGMTLQQVEDLLGGPPGDYGWFWFGSSMMTKEEAGVPPGSTERVWFNDDQRIEVHLTIRAGLSQFIDVQ